MWRIFIRRRTGGSGARAVEKVPHSTAGRTKQQLQLWNAFLFSVLLFNFPCTFHNQTAADSIFAHTQRKAITLIMRLHTKPKKTKPNPNHRGDDKPTSPTKPNRTEPNQMRTKQSAPNHQIGWSNTWRMRDLACSAGGEWQQQRPFGSVWIT